MSATRIFQLLDKPRIGKPDLVRARAEALKPEATDQPGKPVDAAELAAVQAAALKPKTAAAKKYFPTLVAELESLKQSGGGVGEGAVPLSPAGAKRPVFINDAGWPVASADLAGQPVLSGAQDATYRLALLISQSVQADKKASSVDALSLALKAKLVDNLITLAKQSAEAGDGGLPGLTNDQTRQLRSSAFTALWYLGAGLPSSGATQQMQERIHGLLIQLAEHEPQKFLGRHFARVLDRAEYRSQLTPDQAADVGEVFSARYPKKFDTGNILDADGYISWEHACGQGENFYSSFVLNLMKKNLGGAKFEKLSASFDRTEFQLTFNPPRGNEGRVKGVRLTVRRYEDDMYASVGKKKGFSYGGHSDLGENQERSMLTAITAGLKANSPQIALLDACATLDNLDDVLENLGDIEALATFGSSFFWKGKLTDETGDEFEGVQRSEGMECLMQMFESLSKEEDYEEMRKRMSSAIYNYAHMRNPNVVFPTLEDYREVRWMHLDGDGDGRMDSDDVLFQCGLKQALRDEAGEFKLKDDGEADELAGEAVKNATLDLNVASHYNAITEGDSDVEHKFQGSGFFESTDPSDLVRFTPGVNHDGSPVVEVSVNSGLAHTTREALEALVQYSAIVSLADQGKVSGLNEIERKLMGLTFAVFRLNYDSKNLLNDQRIWKQLLTAVRLPAELPYGPLQSILEAEHEDYSGNKKVVAEYQAQLSPETLAKLAVHDVGRPGGGAPSQPIA